MLAALGAAHGPLNEFSHPWNSALTYALIALFVALFILLAPGIWGVCTGLRNKQTNARFRREARRLASGGGQWAVAVISLLGLNRLPVGRRKGAMASLRLYLESFIEPGEGIRRLKTDEFGLILRCGEGAALSHRLAILAQDVGFLYVAAYRCLPFEPRVASCRMDEAESPQDALDCARSRLPKRPDARLKA